MKLVLQYDDDTEPVSYLDWHGVVPPPLPGDEIRQGGKVYRVTTRRYQFANDHLRQSGKLVVDTYAEELVLQLAVVPRNEAAQDPNSTSLALAHPWLPALGAEVFIYTRKSGNKPVRCPVLEHGRARVAHYGASRADHDDKTCEPCFWAEYKGIKMGPYFEGEESLGKSVQPGGWKRAGNKEEK